MSGVFFLSGVEQFHESDEKPQTQTQRQEQEDALQTAGLQRSALTVPSHTTARPPLTAQIIQLARFTETENTNTQILYQSRT